VLPVSLGPFQGKCAGLSRIGIARATAQNQGWQSVALRWLPWRAAGGTLHYKVKEQETARRQDVAAMISIDSIRSARTRSWEFVLLVCAVGIAGLLCDTWPNAMQGHRIMLHGVFGVLLWVMAVAQFHQHARFVGLVGGADFGRLCRRPSRMVYLVLYVVFGAAQAIRAAAVHPAILPPPENLRDFLAYGVIALMTIRALAALHSRAGRRWLSIKAFRPAALQMSPKSERGEAAVELPSRRAAVQNPL
jgi:hypothetical protein